MTLLVILGGVFLVVVPMVVLGEKFAKPISNDEQLIYFKWIVILVFISLIVALIKSMME